MTDLSKVKLRWFVSSGLMEYIIEGGLNVEECNTALAKKLCGLVDFKATVMIRYRGLEELKVFLGNTGYPSTLQS